jgi:hypothetical protein
MLRRGRLGFELRRRSGGLWSTAMTRRRSTWHGELENVVAVLDCIQQRERKAAGGSADVGKLRVTTRYSNCCKIEHV